MSEAAQKNRWGADRRQEFIDFRLAWEGWIQRGQLVEFFGISIQQASTDLNRYLLLYPSNMKYDASKKAYVAGEDFKPQLISADADSYLSPLLSVGIGLRRKDESFIGTYPDLGAIPSFKRWIDPFTLFNVLSAMRSPRKDLFVTYQSLTRGTPNTRWLSPHALGFDGFRWHIRAYCHLREMFRDFVLARITTIHQERRSEIDPALDTVWNRFVKVKIGPHPRFSAGQKKIIESDYGMADGQKEIEIRGALLFYLLRRLGLEKTDTSNEDPNPDRNQIVLLNKKEIEEVLKENEADTP